MPPSPASHRLNILQEQLTQHLADCQVCKAPCCRMFEYIQLTADEYFSGKFKNTVTLKSGLRTKTYAILTKNRVCPYLDEQNNACSIYNDRPFVCRVYTCTNDPKITNDLRFG